MSFLLPLLANLRHYWKPLSFLMLALAAGIYIGTLKMNARHWHKLADNRQATIDKFAVAQALANARATSLKLSTEATFAKIKEDNAHALTLARADAAARLSDWMRTHRADQGAARQADLSGDTHAASGSDADARATFLVGSDDLTACTAAYVTATGWQKWWADIQATQRSEK